VQKINTMGGDNKRGPGGIEGTGRIACLQGIPKQEGKISREGRGVQHQTG